MLPHPGFAYICTVFVTELHLNWVFYRGSWLETGKKVPPPGIFVLEGPSSPSLLPFKAPSQMPLIPQHAWLETKPLAKQRNAPAFLSSKTHQVIALQKKTTDLWFEPFPHSDPPSPPPNGFCSTKNKRNSYARILH